MFQILLPQLKKLSSSELSFFVHGYAPCFSIKNAEDAEAGETHEVKGNINSHKKHCGGG